MQSAEIKIIGIDGSAKAAECGICKVVETDKYSFTNLNDIDWYSSNDKYNCIAIDTPFGWPSNFVDQMKVYSFGKYQCFDNLFTYFRIADIYIKYFLVLPGRIDVLSIASDKLARTTSTVLTKVFKKLNERNKEFSLLIPGDKMNSSLVSIVESYPRLELMAIFNNNYEFVSEYKNRKKGDDSRKHIHEYFKLNEKINDHKIDGLLSALSAKRMLNNKFVSYKNFEHRIQKRLKIEGLPIIPNNLTIKNNHKEIDFPLLYLFKSCRSNWNEKDEIDHLFISVDEELKNDFSNSLLSLIGNYDNWVGYKCSNSIDDPVFCDDINEKFKIDTVYNKLYLKYKANLKESIYYIGENCMHLILNKSDIRLMVKSIKDNYMVGFREDENRIMIKSIDGRKSDIVFWPWNIGGKLSFAN